MAAIEENKKVRKGQRKGSMEGKKVLKPPRNVMQKHPRKARKAKKVSKAKKVKKPSKARKAKKSNKAKKGKKTESKKRHEKPEEKGQQPKRCKGNQEVKSTVKRGPKKPVHEFEGEPTVLEDQKGPIWAELSRQWKSGKSRLTAEDFDPVSFQRTSFSTYWKRDMPAVGIKTKGKGGKAYAYFSFPRALAMNIGVALHCARVVVPDSVFLVHPAQSV